MSEGYEAIQPTDTTDTDTAVRNVLAKRRRELEYQVQRELQASLRELMRSAEAAFVGETDLEPDAVLAAIQAILSDDPRLRGVLSPGYEDLDAWTKISFRRFSRAREQWRAGEIDRVEHPLQQEYRAYVAVAIAVGNIHSATDRTRYAPITLEKLNIPGAHSDLEGEPTPIGRVRIGAGSTVDLEERATVIPHKDCEHILVIANPREGKDATLSRIAGNLKDEHGYKWVALHDDGRNETPMIATPNDEEPIQQSLESFDQAPKGYPSDVYVPAVSLPDELPRNHVPFTFGVDALTPEIIAQLSGVKPQGSTQRRIKHALNEVEEGSGSVDELIRLIEKYADETSMEITVTELRDQDELEEDDVESVTRTYPIGEEKILNECAQSLMMLASEGLLRNSGAETNLDMTDVLSDQEHVAVLNCNNLEDGDEHLKYLIENIWLRLINLERDRNPWLPRLAIEIREIKELAPSTLDRAKYSTIAKSLQQTLFHLSSQGGSRRIMLLGSTQYIRDVYKPVRGNMPIKILLKMGQEKISTLESAGFKFSFEQKQQLNSFGTGWGMLLTPGGMTYPINWTGPKCALGLGDLEWLDRYGIAMGFRVDDYDAGDLEGWHHDATTYVDKDGRRRQAPPDQSEWYLLPADLEEANVDADQGDLAEEVLLELLETRQEYPVPQDLRPKPVDVATEQRQLQLVSTSEAEERETNEVYQTYDITGVLRDWTRRKERTVEKMVMLLKAIRDEEITKYADLEAYTGIGVSSIKQYANDEERLKACLNKDGETYTLTPVGRKALDISWSAAFDDL